jgi:hypothetical protein
VEYLDISKGKVPCRRNAFKNVIEIDMVTCNGNYIAPFEKFTHNPVTFPELSRIVEKF